MKGDFSRLTFDRKKHYSAVLMQQGRVQLDADWNEQQAITRHYLETGTRDLMGPEGAPKKEAGFEITVKPGNQLAISFGHYYVNGLLCENEKDVAYNDSDPDKKQPDLPEPPDPVAVLKEAKATFGVVYLDVWKRLITAVEDHTIREKALGGPDTAVRAKTVWQVKVLPVTSVNQVPEVCGAVSEWAGLIKPPAVTMNARTTGTKDEDKPCSLPPTAGYLRLENQLYRVEVHKPGKQGKATFKWSRDNGSVVTSVEKMDGLTLTVSDAGKDEILGFKNGQWVEIIDDIAELKQQPGQLLQIDYVNSSTREIVLKTMPVPVDKKWHPRLRAWDSEGEIKLEIPAGNDGWIPLEGGIEVRFSSGDYKTADFWLIPARTATGEIEWPPYEVPNTHPVPQPPLGIDHCYAALAWVKIENNQLSRIKDCRKMFPPVTEITADDVSLDPVFCKMPGVTTVQEAIDWLCQNQKGSCNIVPVPGPGWEKVLTAIPDGKDVQICFRAGTYPLEKTVVLKNKGDVKITGAGPGTRIQGQAVESVLRFENCESVDVTDISGESGAVGAKADNDHLNGTLTFVNCKSVSVQNVALRCAEGGSKGAACLTVKNAVQSGGSLPACETRILNCDFGVGHQQVGILAVNVKRAQIEGNVIGVNPLSKGNTPGKLAADKRYAAEVRKALLSNAYFSKEPPSGGRTNASVKAGDYTVHFKTDKTLTDAMQKLVTAKPPAGLKSQADLWNYLKAVTDQVIRDEGETVVQGMKLFKGWYNAFMAQNPAVAAQGIVCGGQKTEEIIIKNNTIEGVLQGIHIGLSHSESKPGTPDMAGRICMADNRIAVSLPAQTKRERHGIFVGNCGRLFIENNEVRVTRLGTKNNVMIEGIRVYGFLGRMMMIRENYLEGCNTGATAFVLNSIAENQKQKYFQWLISDNMAPGATTAVSVNSTAIRQGENYK